MTQAIRRFWHRPFTRPSITWKESVAIVLPLMAEHLFTVLFGLVNTDIATGASVVVANDRGRGDESRLHESIVQAVTPVTLLTTAFIVVFHRPQDVRDLGRSYIWLNSVIYVFASAVTMLLFPYLVSFYHAPAETVELIRLCVLITAVAHPFLHSIGFTLPSVFRAVRDGVYCTVSVLAIMWIVRRALRSGRDGRMAGHGAGLGGACGNVSHSV